LVASLFLLSTLFNGVNISQAADIPYEVPKLVSFTVSAVSVDVGTSPVNLVFSLTVSHPIGIASTRTNLNFVSQDGRISRVTSLIRQSTTSSSNQPVVFSGNLNIDSTIPTGLYNFYAEPIQGEKGPTYRSSPVSSNFYPPKFSTFLNGESSVQVRKFGRLDLTKKTFVGPSYQSNNYLEDSSPVTYKAITPIFRVGEIYNPNEFFVIRIPQTKLLVESFTTPVCETRDGSLYFISRGTCRFKVYSESTSDYQSTSIILESEISEKRTQPIITPPKINDQDVSLLPKEIESFVVRDNVGRIASIVNETPQICYSSNKFSTLIGSQIITIVAGGNCVISYETFDSIEYLSSGPYKTSFTIMKKIQYLSANVPTLLKLSQNTLRLQPTSSSNLPVVSESRTPNICTVKSNILSLISTGNCILNFVQSGSEIFESISETAAITIQNDLMESKNVKCKNIKTGKSKMFHKYLCPKGFKRI
jgi:hypothetical protein